MKITIETDSITLEAIGKILRTAKKKSDATWKKIVGGCHKLNISLYDNVEDQGSNNLSAKEEISFAAIGIVSILWAVFCLCLMILIWGGGLYYSITEEEYGVAIFTFLIGAVLVLKALPNWIKPKKNFKRNSVRQTLAGIKLGISTTEAVEIITKSKSSKVSSTQPSDKQMCEGVNISMLYKDKLNRMVTVHNRFSNDLNALVSVGNLSSVSRIELFTPIISDESKTLAVDDAVNLINGNFPYEKSTFLCDKSNTSVLFLGQTKIQNEEKCLIMAQLGRGSAQLSLSNMKDPEGFKQFSSLLEDGLAKSNNGEFKLIKFGRNSTRGTFENLLSTSAIPSNKPLFGEGDGSYKNPVIIHANDSMTGWKATFKWIEKRYGKQNEDWTIEMTCSLKSDVSIKHIELVKIKMDSAKVDIYFDQTSFIGKY